MPRRTELPLEADYAPLTVEQAAALRAYVRDHGRGWRDRLWLDWISASAAPSLHHLRNTHGPCWLRKFRLGDLRTISKEDNHVG